MAETLQAMREAAGLTADAVAETLDVARTTVYRWEHAKVAPKSVTLRALLHLYGAGESDTERVLAHLAAAHRPAWWHAFHDVLPEHLAEVIDLESAARVIRTYAPGVIPELLQTSGYAAALLRLRNPWEKDAAIERRVELILARQRAAFERPAPLWFWAVIEESVLRRPVGRTEVLREQIQHLRAIKATRSSRITVQVMPGEAPPHLMAEYGTADVIRLDHHLVADRLVTRGLHPETATITTNRDAVRAYMLAMDQSATMAPRRNAPIPPIRLTNGETL
ncbi:helix-turn-helix domain-containing protein [Streptomyces sp. SBT349]|uniref:helix-turn-helix domain-containing protein n=1 Tax=Streptomyces sp. SBT349 TaxID=1580539 RepID=UPI00066D04B7|nr:helix-turn-helix transcriptional regulator [Streptomyces sp. SBT349]